MKKQLNEQKAKLRNDLNVKIENL